MPSSTPTPADAFVTELLRAGIALSRLCEDLLDSIPADAFPGEDAGAVLLEMVIGSAEPVTTAAGEPLVASATALIAATMDRMLADLRAAAAG
jgi:hypothetical protein